MGFLFPNELWKVYVVSLHEARPGEDRVVLASVKTA